MLYIGIFRLDNKSALELLKINLDKYSEYLNEKNIFDSFVADTKTNEANLWSSSLNDIDINALLKPLPCGNEISSHVFCGNSNINEETVQEFMNLFDQTPQTVKQDINNEPRVRRIAKSFAPNCCVPKDKIFKTASADSLEDRLLSKTMEPLKEAEQTPTTISCFKSAYEELQMQNQKKIGVRSASQNQLQTGGPVVGQKRKLGTRRTLQNKFVSPMLSNNLR